MAGRISIIPTYAMNDKRLTFTDVRVLSMLGSYTDRNGWCYPSQQTIADDMGVSRMTVSRCIKKLCKYGHILSRPKYRPDGSKTVNEYKVLLDKEWDEVLPPTASDEPEAPVTEALHGCNKVVTGDVTPMECYNKERPIRTKKEITNLSFG